MSDPSSESPARPGFLEKVRSALGLAAPSLRDDLEDALEQPDSTEDSFSPQERTLLRNVLELHHVRVGDIMVPRADIVAVGAKASLGEVLALFRSAGHSRLPAHGETLDDPRGMVHIRDFVDHLAGAVETARAPRRNGEGGAAPGPNRAMRLAALGAVDLSASLESAGVIRPVLFVPPSMPALDLLVKMQASRIHMALVIDEYGGTDGLVSIEDVMEIIVGDIEDEHDLDEAPAIEKAGPDDYIIDARADLETLAEAVGIDFQTWTENEDVDTIAGLVTLIAGRVPASGEVLRPAAAPFTLEILDADPRRVKRVRLRLVKEEAAPGNPA